MTQVFDDPTAGDGTMRGNRLSALQLCEALEGIRETYALGLSALPNDTAAARACFVRVEIDVMNLVDALAKASAGAVDLDDTTQLDLRDLDIHASRDALKDDRHPSDLSRLRLSQTLRAIARMHARGLALVWTEGDIPAALRRFREVEAELAKLSEIAALAASAADPS